MTGNKKVAIVSCYFQPNYGSQLQAYATQRILDKLGIANETICIGGLRKEINRAKYRYFISRIFHLDTIRDKMATVRKAIAIRRYPDYARNSAIRKAKFDEFAVTMFRLSRIYGSKAELGRCAGDYSTFIVGSDQLWLPSNIEADYYTLNFVPDSIKKIAYATSFGVSSLPHKQAVKATAFLGRLDSIAVREKSGQDIVMKLTGRDVPIVCDPTLLFTAAEWDETASASPHAGEKYIFCYFLGNNPPQREWVKRLKETTGCSIIQMQHCDEYISCDEVFADHTPYDIGPKEFISLIRDAEYVCTDSFHCTVFSILYSKRFFTFRRYGKDSTVSTNSRLYSLLSLAGLESRMLKGDEDTTACSKSGIDYGPVHNRIDSLRQKSVEWLCNSLA